MIFVKQLVDNHFDETRDDIAELDSDCPIVISVGNFGGDWDEAVQKLIEQTQSADFKFRTTTRKDTTNDWEENDFQMGI